jgi:hypothetical protein
LEAAFQPGQSERRFDFQHPRRAHEIEILIYRSITGYVDQM